MIRGNELIKQIRKIESEKLKEERELAREDAKIRQLTQAREKIMRQVEVVESRTKLMEETLSRVKETNYHKKMEIKELELRLNEFRKEYCELKDKMSRGEKLYDEVRGNFLEEVRKMNKALFQSKKFYTPGGISERTRKMKESLVGMNLMPNNKGNYDEGELMRLVEDNKRMEILASEMQNQVRQFDKMELDSEEEIRSEQSIEDEKTRFQELIKEKMMLEKQVSIESEKMKEFEKEYDLLKNDVESGLTQMSEFFCTECNNPLSTLQ